METQRRRIKEFLSSHNTASLATCQDDQPWAASVFYVSDADLSLYFVTDPKTRHGQQLNKRVVAATVNADCDSWSGIRGLQLTGTAAQLAPGDRDRVLALYLNKFPELRNMLEQPADEQQKTIATRLLATPFYCIRPDWIRLIDNSVHFGFKAEINL